MRVIVVGAALAQVLDSHELDPAVREAIRARLEVSCTAGADVLDAAVLSEGDEDPWARAAYSAQSAKSPLASEELTRPVGPLFFAGEHTAGAWHGLMEGALRSGERAAQQLVQTIRR